MKKTFEVIWFCIIGVPLYLAVLAIVEVAWFILSIKYLLKNQTIDNPRLIHDETNIDDGHACNSVQHAGETA